MACVRELRYPASRLFRTKRHNKVRKVSWSFRRHAPCVRPCRVPPNILTEDKVFYFYKLCFFFHHYTCSLVFLDLWYSSILISPNGLSWLPFLFIPRFRKFLFELPEIIELLRVNFATNIYLECMCVVGILYMWCWVFTESCLCYVLFSWHVWITRLRLLQPISDFGRSYDALAS